MTARRLTALALLLFAASAARAQYTQYTGPGQFSYIWQTNKQNIDGAIKTARWKFGRIFVDPWLSLRDIAVVSDFGSDEILLEGPAPAERRSSGADLTASLGAGLRAYLPVGQRLSFAVHALPEYAWWRDNEDRRRLNGRYGAGVFGGLGRANLELSVRRAEEIRIFSREFEERVNERNDEAAVELELGLVGGLSVFANARFGSSELIREGQEELLRLAALDRDDVRYQVGARYRFERGVRVGFGYEEFESEFDRENDLRFTQGSSVVLGLQHSVSLWAFNLDLGFQEIEIGRGPDLLEDDEVRGQLQVLFRATQRMNLQAFADRNLAFSIQQASPFFDDTRYGLALQADIAEWGNVRVFAEQGEIDFTAFAGAETARLDEFDGLGADVFVSFRGITLQLGVTHTEYDSNIPAFDRDITITRISLAFGRRGFRIGTGGVTLGTGELSPWA